MTVDANWNKLFYINAYLNRNKDCFSHFFYVKLTKSLNQVTDFCWHKAALWHFEPTYIRISWQLTLQSHYGGDVVKDQKQTSRNTLENSPNSQIKCTYNTIITVFIQCSDFYCQNLVINPKWPFLFHFPINIILQALDNSKL